MGGLEKRNEEKKSSKEKVVTMFKKKDDTSKEKKIEVVSKNHSGLGFKKKTDSEAGKDAKILPKRIPLREDVNTSRSVRKDTSHDKPSKKSSHERSVFEEEKTLEEQGYGLLLRDMKRCIKGEHSEEGRDSSWKEREEEKVRPKYLNMEKVPGVGQHDTVGSKIEALRMYLEEQIGDSFYRVY